MEFSYAPALVVKYLKIHKTCTFVYSWNHKKFWRMMGARDQYIHQCHIPCCSLLSMNKCPWQCVFVSGDDHTWSQLVLMYTLAIYSWICLLLCLSNTHLLLTVMVSSSSGRCACHEEGKDSEPCSLPWPQNGMEQDREVLMVLQLTFCMIMNPIARYP